MWKINPKKKKVYNTVQRLSKAERALEDGYYSFTRVP